MNPASIKSTETGFTLMEMLVTLVIASLLMMAVVSTFSMLSRIAVDNKLKVVAQLEAQSALEMMTPEIRMIGNGVPFHQANFLIGQENLADNTVTQPILVSGTTSSQIRFRLNETGETYILTAAFNPAASTTIALTSTGKIFSGDQIYITNATVGDDDGLWATVSAVNDEAHTVTISAGAQYSPGATFAMGSLLEVVPIVTYTSHASFGGISRDNGTGALTLVPDGQFSLEYLNSDGDPIALPLAAVPDDPFPANSIQNVHAIRMTVQVRTGRAMSNGLYYTASSTQSVGIRNLNFKY